jgi:hypothetical protein
LACPDRRLRKYLEVRPVTKLVASTSFLISAVTSAGRPVQKYGGDHRSVFTSLSVRRRCTGSGTGSTITGQRGQVGGVGFVLDFTVIRKTDK